MRVISPKALAQLTRQKVSPFIACQIDFTDLTGPGVVSALGPRRATVGVNFDLGGGRIAWTNPGNVTTPSSLATVALTSTQVSQLLRASGFGYLIPFDFVISGIQVTAKAQNVNGGLIATISVGSQLKSVPTTASLLPVTMGGPDDLWGNSELTPDQLNDPAFFVQFYNAGATGSETDQITDVQLTVFATGQHLNLWTGGGILTMFDEPFLGVGKFAGIAPVTETADVEANGVELSLSGIDPDILGQALGVCRQGQPVRLWFGFMDENGAIIPDPSSLFVGRLDTVGIDEGADTATISLTAESRVIDLQRARIRRYTDDDQQRTSPGDLGFKHVPEVQDWNGQWGRSN